MQALKFTGEEQTKFIYLTRNTPGAKFGIQKLFLSTLWHLSEPSVLPYTHIIESKREEVGKENFISSIF